MSYRLLTYAVSKAEARAGIEVGGAVYDAAKAAGVAAWSNVPAILEDWKKAKKALADAAKRIAAGKSRLKGTPLAKTRLRAPLLPGAIYCAGANYSDHVNAMAKALGMPPPVNPKTLGLKSWHFQKAPRSSVVGPDAAVRIPSPMMDWEIELAAVIGVTAKNVPVEKALSHVAGYTIANDLSARDLGKRPHVPDASPFKWDWIGQKNFDGCCPLGPWIVPASDIRDPQNLGMKLWVGSELMQDANTGLMIYSLADQIADISGRITLNPGDLILTGTPCGVGMERGRFLQPGEVVKLWIEKIGELSNKMV